MSSRRIDRLLRGLQEQIGPFSLTYFQGDTMITMKQANFSITNENYQQELQCASPKSPKSPKTPLRSHTSRDSRGFTDYHNQHLGNTKEWCPETQTGNTIPLVDNDTDESDTMIASKHDQQSIEQYVDPKLQVLTETRSEDASPTNQQDDEPVEVLEYTQNLQFPSNDPPPASERSLNADFVSETPPSLPNPSPEKSIRMHQRHRRQGAQVIDEAAMKEAIAREIGIELQYKGTHICPRPPHDRGHDKVYKLKPRNTDTKKHRNHKKIGQLSILPTQRQSMLIPQPVIPNREQATSLSLDKETTEPTPVIAPQVVQAEAVLEETTDNNEEGVRPHSEPHLEPQLESRLDPQLESHSDPRSEPHLEPRSELHLKPHLEPHSESRLDPQLKSHSEPRTEPHLEPHDAGFERREGSTPTSGNALEPILPKPAQALNLTLSQKKKDCKYVFPLISQLVREQSYGNSPAVLSAISKEYWSLHVMRREVITTILTKVLRVIHPERRKLFPYVKKEPPKWWPQPVAYKDPAHLAIDERTYLLLWILVHTGYNFKVIRKQILISVAACRRKWTTVTAHDTETIETILDQCEEIRNFKFRAMMQGPPPNQ